MELNISMWVTLDITPKSAAQRLRTFPDAKSMEKKTHRDQGAKEHQDNDAVWYRECRPESSSKAQNRPNSYGPCPFLDLRTFFSIDFASGLILEMSLIFALCSLV